MMNTARHGRLNLKTDYGFVLFHLVPLAALWTGATAFDWTLCIFLYYMRMFFITAGYHRYFAHRTFKTSRVFQFILAFMAQTSLQKGALWWAYVHREHHRYSDTWDDPHSRVRYGFWYSHVGWIFDPRFRQTRYEKVKDFARFPELVWLNTAPLPALVLPLLVFFLGGIVNGGSLAAAFTHGWSTLVVGFFLSTVLLFHGTYSINSLMHKIGTQRYQTGDESRNSFLLALLTMGEGWHNNHHYYQSTARQGFFWWEFDATYYLLRLLAWCGVIWDLRPVPDHVKHSRNLNEARQLAQQARAIKQ